MAPSATAPPFLGSWASVFVIWLAILYCVSCVVHLANLVLFPVLLVVPAALAWSLYVGWLRSYKPGLDNLFFKMSTYGLGLSVLVTVLFALLLAPLLIAAGMAADDSGTGTAPLGNDDSPNVDDGYGAKDAPADAPVYIAVSSYFVLCVVMACISETTKVRFSHPPVTLSHNPQVTLALLMATSLGFSLGVNVSNLLYSYAIAGGYQSSKAGGVAVTEVVRSLTGAPMHALCALVSGLRIVVRNTQRARQMAQPAHPSAVAGTTHVCLQQQQVPDENAGQVGASLQPQQQQSLATPAQQQPLATPAPGASASLQQSQQERDHVTLEPNGVHSRVLSTSPLRASTTPSSLDEWHSDDAAAVDSNIGVWSWPRVMWPAIAMNLSYQLLDVIEFGVFGDGRDSNGQAALFLVLHAALLLGCFAVVNHLYLQQWVQLMGGTTEPQATVPRRPLASVLRPFWWRPEFAAAADDSGQVIARG